MRHGLTWAHSALSPAKLITLAHFSVSSAISLPNAAGYEVMSTMVQSCTEAASTTRSDRMVQVRAMSAVGTPISPRAMQ